MIMQGAHQYHRFHRLFPLRDLRRNLLFLLLLLERYLGAIKHLLQFKSCDAVCDTRVKLIIAN